MTEHSYTEEYEMIDFLNVGMSITDKNLDIIFINKKAVNLLDMPENMAKKGTNLKEIIHYNAARGEYGNGTIEVLTQQRLKLVSQKKPYRFIHERPNGIFLEINGNPTSSGGFATTYTDVTEIETARRIVEKENLELVEQILEKNKSLRTEKRKIEQETKIRNIILESTPHGITLVDKDLNLVICNDKFLELLDFPPDMAKTGTPLEAFFRFNAKRGEYGDVDIERAIKERLQTAKLFEPHCFTRTTSGDKIIEVNGVPLSKGFVTTYSDVTDLVKAREASDNLNKKWKEIIDSSPVGMGIIRISDSSIVQINPTAATLFGYSNSQDALGTSARKLWISDTQRIEFISIFQENGFVISEEIELKDIKGDHFYCYLSWYPVKHEGDDCIFFWIYDITNKKNAQKQLFDSEKLASLGGLVAGVAHEINTPIGIGVTATSHLIEEINSCDKKLAAGKLSKSNLENLFRTSVTALSIVLSNLQSAAALVQNFKLVSVDQISEEKREIQVSEYFKSILASLEPKIRKARVKVNLNCMNDCNFYTYPGAISQIMTNLITNAITHGFENTNSGVIDINVSGHPGEGLEIKFEDNGKGIPEDIISKVLDPFFTTKRGQGGSGLGLSIVHNIITQTFKGSLSIKSVYGEGTIIYITLPVISFKM